MSLSEPIRNYADSTIRTTLQHPEHLRAVLEHTVPDLAANFLVEQAKPLGTEFYTDDWRGREADVPFEVPYQAGKKTVKSLVVVLIEHQSETDRMMPLRLLYFAVVYWDRCWRQWEKDTSESKPENFLLPPILPIVFYTANRPWGSSQTIVDLLGAPDELHQFAPVWQPLFWNLSEENAEELVKSKNLWLQCLAVIRAREEPFDAFQRTFLLVMENLNALASEDRARWDELWRMSMVWMLANRTDPEKEALRDQLKQHKDQNQWTEEVREMAMRTEMSVLERLEKETELRTTRRVIKDVLVARFQSVDERILQQIDAVDDLARLQEFVTLAATIDSLDKFKVSGSATEE